MAGEKITLGDAVVKSNTARKLFDIDGNEIKVGIIASSFNSLSGLDANVESGDLPGESNPFNYDTPISIINDSNNSLSNDEGRALAQIVHDVAPGAELFFHSIFDSNDFANEESFSEAVSALVGQGVDVIVEDAIVQAPFLQDGKAAKAIEDAIDKGVTFVSAAGNNGGISYESVFDNSGEEFAIEDNNFQLHDFDTGEGVDVFQDIEVTEEGTLIRPLVSWDEAIGEVNSEHILFLVNTPELPNENNIVGISIPPGESDINEPISEISYAPKKGEELYFVAARPVDADNSETSFFKWISSANGLSRTTKYEYIDESANNQTVYGQSNAPSSITVGATDIENPQQIRSYSSRGGSPIIFDSEGNRLAKFDSRSKPEVYAPDGVETNFPTDSEFALFNGTSAAAPHIAGIVALMLERAGGSGSLSPEEIRTILQNTALPVESEQTDAGLAQADQATINSFNTEYIGTDENDFIDGSEDADNFYGKNGNDIFQGYGGSDYFLGEQGNDVLSGGSGNDVLVGGEGYNYLEGGGEKDTFVLETNGTAVIPDFEIDNDTLAITGIEDSSSLSFSDVGNDYTLVENGESTLAFLSGTIESENINITYI